ncbi:hypothetical protein Hdeb2414_s0019g00551451 [Helianthus debilis subsp. tardiflorus]
MKNGKLDKEFTLSSTDLFHSPSGFIHLSFSYTGASPDVMTIPPPPHTAKRAADTDSELTDFDKIEFPDPKVVKTGFRLLSFGVLRIIRLFLLLMKFEKVGFTVKDFASTAFVQVLDTLIIYISDA